MFYKNLRKFLKLLQKLWTSSLYWILNDFTQRKTWKICSYLYLYKMSCKSLNGPKNPTETLNQVRIFVLNFKRFYVKKNLKNLFLLTFIKIVLQIVKRSQKSYRNFEPSVRLFVLNFKRFYVKKNLFSFIINVL